MVSAAKPSISVIIPTHDHGETLRYSIGSILKQTYQDFEILVIGDGVPDITRAVMKELIQQDSRIRFFDKPKGPRYGEIYRHEVLTTVAQGEIVAYLSDDDLWLPDHLAIIAQALQSHNFANTLHTNVNTNSTVTPQLVDLDIPAHRYNLNNNLGFGLAFGAHTMELYRKLPYGWRTTPKGTHTDVYMWAQLVTHQECIPISIHTVTGLHLASTDRKSWNNDQRLVELKLWSERVADAQEVTKIKDEITAPIIKSYIRNEVSFTWQTRKRIIKLINYNDQRKEWLKRFVAKFLRP